MLLKVDQVSFFVCGKCQVLFQLQLGSQICCPFFGTLVWHKSRGPATAAEVWGATAACHFVAGVVWSTVATAQHVPSPNTKTALWKKTDNDAPLLCIPLELCQMNLNLTHTVPRKQSTGSWHTISQLLWSGTSSNHIYQFKPCACQDLRHVCENTIPKMLA